MIDIEFPFYLKLFNVIVSWSICRICHLFCFIYSGDDRPWMSQLNALNSYKLSQFSFHQEVSVEFTGERKYKNEQILEDHLYDNLNSDRFVFGVY